MYIDYHVNVGGEIISPDEKTGNCFIPNELGPNTAYFCVSECVRFQNGRPVEFQVVAMKNGDPLPGEKCEDREDCDVLFSLAVTSFRPISIRVAKIVMESIREPTKIVEIFNVDLVRERNTVYVEISKGVPSFIIHRRPEDKMLYFEDIYFPEGLKFLRMYEKAIRALFEKYNYWARTGKTVAVYYIGSEYKEQRQSTLREVKKESEASAN